MDCHSRLEALSRFHGKPPALRGLPFILKEFLAGIGDGTGHGTDYSKPGTDSFLIKPG